MIWSSYFSKVFIKFYTLLQGVTKPGAKSQKSSFCEMKDAKTWEFFHWIESKKERKFRSIFGMNFFLWRPVLVYMLTRCWWFLRALDLWHCCMMLVMTTLRCCDLFHRRLSCWQNACFLWHLLLPSVMVCLVGWFWLIGWAALGWCCTCIYTTCWPHHNGSQSYFFQRGSWTKLYWCWVIINKGYVCGWCCLS